MGSESLTKVQVLIEVPDQDRGPISIEARIPNMTRTTRFELVKGVEKLMLEAFDRGGGREEGEGDRKSFPV